jgi:hypothetical protein
LVDFSGIWWFLVKSCDLLIFGDLYDISWEYGIQGFRDPYKMTHYACVSWSPRRDRFFFWYFSWFIVIISGN